MSGPRAEHVRLAGRLLFVIGQTDLSKINIFFAELCQKTKSLTYLIRVTLFLFRSCVILLLRFFLYILS